MNCSVKEKEKVIVFRPHPKPEKRPKKPLSRIRRRSKKGAALERRYSSISKKFLLDKICPITGQPATEVHHKKGREGYADEWARINDIPLLIDERFFLGVSRTGHIKIEANPEWAKQMGYSVDRLH